MKQNLYDFFVNEKLNVDVANQFFEKYGNYDLYEKLFFTKKGDKLIAKNDFADFISRVPIDKVLVYFLVEGNARTAGRRYQETFICQTPMNYAYEDLVRLYDENIPKIRNRNATRARLEPLIPVECAKYLIIKALTESTMVNGRKEILFAITDKSIKVSFTSNDNIYKNEERLIKKEYFDIMGIDTESILDNFKLYSSKHRIQNEFSYHHGIMNYELFFDMHKNLCKKYMRIIANNRVLTKSESDIYDCIQKNGGVSIQQIADEFGYASNRTAKYHVDKLIKMGTVERVGPPKSHYCFYRIKK